MTAKYLKEDFVRINRISVHEIISGEVVKDLAGEAVSIKGTRNGLVIIFDPDMDIEEIKSTLKLKMEKSKGFFKGAKFVVHNCSSGSENQFVTELEGICLQYGLIPSPEVSWTPSSGDCQPEPPPARRKKADIIPLRQQADPDGEQAVLVARTLRSGHQVSCRQTIVIMGDVNPGAEVISGGSIYVLGSCKGTVHAGSEGNLMSEVYAMKLQPAVLRIGSFTADTSTRSKPAAFGVARVVRGRITICKL